MLQWLMYLPRALWDSPHESLAMFYGSVADLISSMVVTNACGKQGDRGSSVIFSLFPTILLED